MKESRRKGQHSRDGITSLAIDASNLYLSLLGLAMRNGFTLKHEAGGVAIFKHRISDAEISVCIFTDQVPEEAREMLKKLIT